MKVIFRNKGASTVVPGRNIFATVARLPSASRLLDATLGRVTAWQDGEPIYVSSFGGSQWLWQADFPAATATDNETTCRPTSWIAGGLPGAAVRSLIGNRVASTQGAWTVDSAAADNEGAGTALEPLKTDIEIQRRWGLLPTIAVPVAITWLQSPAGTTNLAFEITTGGSVSFIGVRTIDRAAVAITAVTVQNRGTQTRWAITGAGLGAVDVGKIGIITASAVPANVGAYFRVIKDNGAGNVTITPAGTFSPSAPFTQVVPAVGDVFDVVSFPTLNVGRVSGRLATQAVVAPTRNCCVIDSLVVEGSTPGFIESQALKIFYVRCLVRNMRLIGTTPSASGTGNAHDCCGSGMDNVLVTAGATLTTRQSGVGVAGVGGIGVLAGGYYVGLTDTYFQNSGLNMNRGGTANTQGINFSDSSSAGLRVIIVQPGSIVQQTGAVPDWGSNNLGQGLIVRAGSTYTYATKPTINAGLGAGRESAIGGVDTLYAAYPATGAVNATNLAAASLFA